MPNIIIGKNEVTNLNKLILSLLRAKIYFYTLLKILTHACSNNFLNKQKALMLQ